MIMRLSLGKDIIYYVYMRIFMCIIRINVHKCKL